MVKAELKKLSRGIKVITLRYTARHNRMHRRVGPVFGDRYRSEAIEDDAYLQGALRYIHLNKVSVLWLLGESVRGFTEFHRQSDLTLYLETSEEHVSYRWIVAHNVLETFCAMHCVERATQLTSGLASRSARPAKYWRHRMPKCTVRCRTTNLRTEGRVGFQEEPSDCVITPFVLRGSD